MREKLIAAGMDYDKAIEISGDEEILMIVLDTYLGEFESTYDSILQMREIKDIDKYTILVHGLKSASRTVGLMEIGDLAEKLQFAGEKEDVEYIESNTGKLLDMYKNACEMLKEAVK